MFYKIDVYIMWLSNVQNNVIEIRGRTSETGCKLKIHKQFSKYSVEYLVTYVDFNVLCQTVGSINDPYYELGRRVDGIVAASRTS